MKKTSVSLSILFLILIVMSFLTPFLLFKMNRYQFLFNTTDSLRGYLFLMKKNQPVVENNPSVERGDVIVFYHDLYPNHTLLKKVSHCEGEPYAAQMLGGLCNINHPFNKLNRVPYRHVAVIGDNIKSFDSRYQTFGFVPFKNIKGKAWKIF